MARFTEAAGQGSPIPVPSVVFVYRMQRPAAATVNTDSLGPFERKACLQIRAALLEKQKFIVLSGHSLSGLATVVDVSLTGLGHQRFNSTQASLLEGLLDEIVEIATEPALETELQSTILVVDNADLLPTASIHRLAELADQSKDISVQIVFIGQRGPRREFGSNPLRALAGRNCVNVMLTLDVPRERAIDIEKHLVSAWQSATVSRSIDDNLETEAVSPYPALAALLGQDAQKGSTTNLKWIVLLLSILLVSLTFYLLFLTRSVKSGI